MASNREDLLQRLIASISIRNTLLHPATLFLAASLVTIVGAIHVWNRYQLSMIDSDSYELTEDKIEIPTPPEWAGGNPKELVLGVVASPDRPPSLLDTQLVSRTVEIFKSVGYVEHVRSVEKSRQGLSIDLVYRDAVGMVEINSQTVPQWSQSSILLPVDRNGVILPGKIVANQELIRFSIFDPARQTGLKTFTEWPDERVRGAAAISAAIGDKWKPLGVFRIVTFRKPSQADASNIPFEIWPDVGTQVVWGNPPGQEIDGEANALQKLEALEQFVMKFGPLDELAKRKIDVRSGRVVMIDDVQTAELDLLMSVDR